MNRRVLTIIVACFVVMTMISNCLAEDFVFSFRNGIAFGDSMEAVKSKETGARDGYDPGSLRCEDIALSGIAKSHIYYYFEFEKLVRILLVYGEKELDVAKKDYDIIREGLIRKYGQPVDDIDNATIYQYGAIIGMRSVKEDDAHTDLNMNADQWVLEVGEGKIIIEHVFYSYYYKRYENSDPELLFTHRTTYQYFPANTQPTDLIDRDL